MNTLNYPELESPGQKWWNGAASKWGYDVRNRLVAEFPSPLLPVPIQWHLNDNYE
ncbi:hypothetical protein [Nostoc sp. TCL240-02]|uniref:hypothetical protein n=1 Tax=Nostoc sp. TCL240-02 TaxID=2572090 RepID=UPI00157F8B70|nr:hypothetical protein [Nostoc sp. TCL240-02]